MAGTLPPMTDPVYSLIRGWDPGSRRIFRSVHAEGIRPVLSQLPVPAGESQQVYGLQWAFFIERGLRSIRDT